MSGAPTETGEEGRYEPVTPRELEEASLRAAQATSTLRIISDACVRDLPETANALGLVADSVHQVACDLSDMHMRHAHHFAKGAQL